MAILTERKIPELAATSESNGSRKSLDVTVIDGAGNIVSFGGAAGGTSSADGDAFTVDVSSGTPAMGVYQSSPSAVTDGDLAIVGITAQRELKVSVTSGGTAGTQYTEGDTDSTITGTAVMWEDAADTLRAVSAAKPLPIGDAGGSLTVDGSLTAVTTVSTVTTITNVVHVDDNAGSLTVDAAELTTIAALSKAEDAAHASGNTGVMALAVRNATVTDLSAGNTDGDYEPLQVSATGRLWASATIDAAIPAGANAIGKLAANSGVDIGDVDVTTVGTITPGTAATSLGKAEDAAHASADVGVMALAVRSNTAASTSGSDGDYQPLITNTTGHLWVDASGQTLTVGSHAVTNAGTFVTQENGAALTSLQLIDDLVYTEDAVAAANPVGVVPILVRKDTPASEVSADGDNIAHRGTAYGAAYVTLLDTSGNTVAVGGGTQYTEDAVAAANPIGTVPILVRTDTPATQVSADGDNIAQRGTNYGAAYVTLLDTGGSAVSVGGGTQYTEDAAAAANPIGNALILVREDAHAGSLVSADGDNVAARGTNVGELYVKHVDPIPVTDNSGSLTVDGGVTIAGSVAHDGVGTGVSPVLNGAYASAAAPSDVSADGDAVRFWALRSGAQVVQPTFAGVLATAGNGVAGTGVQRVTLASDSTGNIATIGTSVTPGSAATNLGKAEDAAHASADVGVMALAVRSNTAASTSGSDGDYQPLITNTTGHLWVDASGQTLTVGSHAVTNAGTFAVQIDAGAVTSLALIDDPVIADDAAFTPATTKVMMAGFEADESSTDSVDEGDGGAARMTLDRKQIVTVQPHTAGGLSVFNGTSSDGGTALTSTAQVISAAAGQIYGWYIYNPNATAQFVQLYNTAQASVTVGTTNPLFMLTIPATSAANVNMVQGIAFSNAGFSCSATSTAGGNGAPGTALDAVIFYK